MSKLLHVVVLTLALTGAALAGPLEDAQAAHYRGDYATAVRLWRPLAENGNARAQVRLGNMYYDGNGVPQDYVAAVQWYRLAAEQRDAVAQASLGFMYENGLGVAQDYVQAHMWLNLAVAYLEILEIGVHRPLALAGRGRVAARMTPAQIAEAQRLAREWDAAHPRR